MPSDPAPLRIVFFGTADFAVPSLEALVEAGHEVVCVVTAPDKPAGRGLTLKPSPVKEAALRLGLPLLQPERLKDEAFLAHLISLAPDLGVVVAFRMLPEVVWQMPRLGTVNVHGSLLPRYRGAAPIHWAVAMGERETGVTTFFLRHQIDTGDLILQDAEPIGPADTAGDVFGRLMHRGAALLVKTVGLIATGKAPRLPQDLEAPTPHAPKLTRDNTEILPDQHTRQQVHNRVRGFAPWPVAWATVAGQYVRLHVVLPLPDGTPGLPLLDDAAPGMVLTGPGRKGLYWRVADGWVELHRLQPEGRRILEAQDVINGGLLPLG